MSPTAPASERADGVELALRVDHRGEERRRQVVVPRVRHGRSPRSAAGTGRARTTRGSALTTHAADAGDAATARSSDAARRASRAAAASASSVVHDAADPRVEVLERAGVDVVEVGARTFSRSGRSRGVAVVARDTRVAARGARPAR